MHNLSELSQELHCKFVNDSEIRPEATTGCYERNIIQVDCAHLPRAVLTLQFAMAFSYQSYVEAVKAALSRCPGKRTIISRVSNIRLAVSVGVRSLGAAGSVPDCLVLTGWRWKGVEPGLPTALLPSTFWRFTLAASKFLIVRSAGCKA